MFQSPSNHVMVLPERKYIGNITTLLKSAAIQNFASVDPSDIVNITGKVISVPKMIEKQRDLEGFTTKDIQPGDIAIFAYNVIYDMIQTETELPIHRNEIFWQGKEYFAAHIRHIFGVIRNGEIIMINGHVMVGLFQESKIVLPASMKKIKGTVKAPVLHIGYPKENEKPINVFQGDMVYFNPLIAQPYQINGKPFVIITQSKILGKEV